MMKNQLQNHTSQRQKKVRKLRLKDSSSSSISDRADNALKISNKDLNATSCIVMSKEVVPPSCTSISDSSLISEVSDDEWLRESTKGLELDLALLDKSFQASSATPDLAFTVNDEPLSVQSGKSVSTEAEVVVDFLMKARSQVWNSIEVDLASRKILDGLIEIAVRDYCSVSKDSRQNTRLVPGRSLFVLLFCVLLLLMMTVMVNYFFSPGSDRFSLHPPPT